MKILQPPPPPQASAGEGFGAENRAISLREAKARASIGERHRQEAANLRQQRAAEWAAHEQKQHSQQSEADPLLGRVTRPTTPKVRPQSEGNAHKHDNSKPPWQSGGLVERSQWMAQDKDHEAPGSKKKKPFKSKRVTIEPSAKGSGGADDTGNREAGEASHLKNEVEEKEAATRPWKPGQPAIPRPWERPHSAGNTAAAQREGGSDGVVWVAGAEGSKEWGKLYSKFSDQTLITKRRSASSKEDDEKTLVRILKDNTLLKLQQIRTI